MEDNIFVNGMLAFAGRLVPSSHPTSKGVLIENDHLVDTQSSDSQLLDYIYAVDPVSGLPSGDLAVYLGDKANPEVRQFIELNLLQPLKDSDGLSQLPNEVTNNFKNISDDDIAFFSRSKNETKEEYADRLKLYFLNEKKIRLAKKRSDELQRVLEGKSND